MSTYSLTLRGEKESKLTTQELDDNFLYLESLGSSLPLTPGNLMNISEGGVVVSSPINRTFVLGETLFETPIIYTGSVDETIIYTQSIPANTLRVGDFMRNQSFVIGLLIDITGTLTFSVYWNSEPTLQGSQLLTTSSVSPGSNLKEEYQFDLIDNGFKVIFISDNSVIGVNTDQIPPIYNEYPIWNLDEDVYLILTLQLADPGDRLCLWSCYFSNSIITSIKN